MIIEKTGDLLTEQADFIAHQVNCRGIMGAGVAKQIRDRLLSPEQYRKYQRACRDAAEGKGPASLLGHVERMPLPDGRQVVNLYAEDKPTGKGLDTDYHALYSCLHRLAYFATVGVDDSDRKTSIAIPGYIGCGLAGGDWDYVWSRILLPVFGRSSRVEFRIVYLESSVRQLHGEFLAELGPDGTLARPWHQFPPKTPADMIEAWFAETFPDVRFTG